MRRSKLRDVAVVGLQMHAYVATYQMPNDDPERLRARVRVRYPVVADRAIGLGELPGLRMQRAFARQEGQPLRVAEQALVWCHWLWFFVPHGTVAYLLARRRDQLAGGAAQIYAVFDLGLIGYWARAHRAAVVRGRAGRRSGRASRACAASCASTDRRSGRAPGALSTMSWEATLSPPCPPCTSRHP